MTRFTSSIRGALELLSSIPMDKCSRLGVAAEVAMDSSADHTSVAVDPATNKVYVADPINRRIQVFDSNGKFLTKWSVPEWGQPHGFEDLAIDSDRGRLYASSANMNTILVFDLQGNRLGTLTPRPPDKLDGPSALALAKDKLFVLNTGSARVSVIMLAEQIVLQAIASYWTITCASRTHRPDVDSKRACEFCCASLLSSSFSASTPGAFHRIHQVSTSMSQRPRYNAYLVSRTGAGEFGPRLPLLFQEFAVSNPNYINPLTIYLLAIVFRFCSPEHSGGAIVRCILDVCGLFAAWRVGKAYFWPAQDRHNRCR